MDEPQRYTRRELFQEVLKSALKASLAASVLTNCSDTEGVSEESESEEPEDTEATQEGNSNQNGLGH